MASEEEDRRYFDRWKALQPNEPTLADVLAAGDGRLFAIYILDGFRIATAEAAEAAARVAKVRAEAVRIFKDEGTVEQFLRTPRALLDGRTPVAVAIDSEEGVERVLRIAGDAAESGYF